MLNFSKTQVNIIVLEILLFTAAVTAILFREITLKTQATVLPDIKTDLEVVLPEEYALPSAKKLDEIIAGTKKKKEKEITIEITDEPVKPEQGDSTKQKEEKPQEFIIELE